MGGICGAVNRGESVIINNCYNIGELTCHETKDVKSTGVGGILGTIGNWSTQAYATIRNCYNIGELKSTYGSLGKILGIEYGNDKKDFFNIYYLDQVQGGDNTYGGTVLDSNSLKKLAQILGETFANDINNINNGYPILKWQTQ